MKRKDWIYIIILALVIGFFTRDKWIPQSWTSGKAIPAEPESTRDPSTDTRIITAQFNTESKTVTVKWDPFDYDRHKGNITIAPWGVIVSPSEGKITQQLTDTQAKGGTQSISMVEMPREGEPKVLAKTTVEVPVPNSNPPDTAAHRLTSTTDTRLVESCKAHVSLSGKSVTITGEWTNGCRAPLTFRFPEEKAAELSHKSGALTGKVEFVPAQGSPYFLLLGDRTITCSAEPLSSQAGWNMSKCTWVPDQW